MDRRLEAGVAALQGTVLDKAVEKGLISKGELVFTKEMLKKGQIPAKVKTIIESMPEYKAAYDAYNKYQKYYLSFFLLISLVPSHTLYWDEQKRT